MAVLTLTGKPINWGSPPKPTALVLWSQRTTTGKRIKASFRTVCWLDRINALSIKKFGRGIIVYQGPYNTGVKASAGTHDYDACLDVWIPGVDGYVQQRFFRANGGSDFFRTPAQGFMEHQHLFVLPPLGNANPSKRYMAAGFKVGRYVDGGYSLFKRQTGSSQIADYYAKPPRNALAGHAIDKTWHPANIDDTVFNLPAHVNGVQKALGVGPYKPIPLPSGLTFKVTTNNLMSLPQNSNYPATINATPAASVVLVQEADVARAKLAIKTSRVYKTGPVPDADVYNAFVLYSPNTWTHVTTKFVKQYDGVGGISKTRHIAVTVLLHKGLGTRVGFISFHQVTAGNDKARKKMRAEALAALRKEISALRAQGIAVIVGGDYNGTGNAHPTATIRTAHGIDQEYVWNGKTMTVRRLSSHTVKTGSDHDALVVEYSAATHK